MVWILFLFFRFCRVLGIGVFVFLVSFFILIVLGIGFVKEFFGFYIVIWLYWSFYKLVGYLLCWIYFTDFGVIVRKVGLINVLFLFKIRLVFFLIVVFFEDIWFRVILGGVFIFRNIRLCFFLILLYLIRVEVGLKEY